MLLSPFCAQRRLCSQRHPCVQVWFCDYLQTDLGVACAQPGGPQGRLHSLTQLIRRAASCFTILPSPICYHTICMLTFLSARNICIFHPLLNEPHLSSIDHSYPSIIKTNILQISYVSASLHLQFCLVSIFYSNPSLIFLELTVP